MLSQQTKHNSLEQMRYFSALLTLGDKYKEPGLLSDGTWKVITTATLPEKG